MVLPKGRFQPITSPTIKDCLQVIETFFSHYTNKDSSPNPLMGTVSSLNQRVPGLRRRLFLIPSRHV